MEPDSLLQILVPPQRKTEEMEYIHPGNVVLNQQIVLIVWCNESMCFLPETKMSAGVT